MTEDEMTKTAEAATAAINMMADSVAPVAVGSHVAVLALLDVLGEDPGFTEKFEAALACRIAGEPPFVQKAAGAFVQRQDEEMTPQ